MLTKKWETSNSDVLEWTVYKSHTATPTATLTLSLGMSIEVAIVTVAIKTFVTSRLSPADWKFWISATSTAQGRCDVQWQYVSIGIWVQPWGSIETLIQHFCYLFRGWDFMCLLSEWTLIWQLLILSFKKKKCACHQSSHQCCMYFFDGFCLDT